MDILDTENKTRGELEHNRWDGGDRLGMTPEQWGEFQRLTCGFGDQDENGVDLSLLRENLKLTPNQRLQRLQSAVNSLRAIRPPNGRYQF